MIDLDCQQCGQTLNVPEEHAGQTGQCQHCGGSVTAPELPQFGGAAPMHSQYGPGSITNISNYLVQAILVTLFCCLPFGIVAIVYAAQVNGKVQAGDTRGALDTSAKAKMWCWIALASGLIPMLLYFAFMMVVLATGF